MKKNNNQRLFEMMEKINPDFKSPDNRIGAIEVKPKLILPVGISGSGKSTWINANTDSNTIVVSPDNIRKELTGNISDQSKNDLIWTIAFKKIVHALNSGKNVILDATNIESNNRKKLLNYLRDNVDRPFDAFAKIFIVDPEIAKQRVKNDIEKGIDRSNVPDWVIDRQYKKFVNDIDSLENDGFKLIK